MCQIRLFVQLIDNHALQAFAASQRFNGWLGNCDQSGGLEPPYKSSLRYLEVFAAMVETLAVIKSLTNRSIPRPSL
jgi:hypothetical protein